MTVDSAIKPIENKTSCFGLMSSEKITSSDWRSLHKDRLAGKGVASKTRRQ